MNAEDKRTLRLQLTGGVILCLLTAVPFVQQAS